MLHAANVDDDGVGGVTPVEWFLQHAIENARTKVHAADVAGITFGTEGQCIS